MNFIKKIVNGQADELVHIQFQKFSKGEFKDRALIEVKKTAKNWAIKTSAEFATDLVLSVAEEVGAEKVQVEGAIVSTVNLKEIDEFREVLASADVKQFQGVKRFILNQEMSGNEIKSIIEAFPKAFFGLTFSSSKSQLKIKAKAPKSGKPGKGDEAPKADFCSLKTENPEIVNEFIFEGDFKVAKVNHTFVINEIIFPEGEKDYSKIRELAKRKGTIIRKSELDGKEAVKEIAFEA